MAGISTHVLDTARGRPVAGMRLRLSVIRDAEAVTVAEAVTDADGRARALLSEAEPGVYRLWFDASGHLGADGFFPDVAITFRVTDPGENYHVPLLLSPFGYSTYRGS
jgi:5-hydroxyisourate hydrolase